MFQHQGRQRDPGVDIGDEEGVLQLSGNYEEPPNVGSTEEGGSADPSG